MGDTRLGKFVQYALRNGDDTLKVNLATATFFSLPDLSKEMTLEEKRCVLSNRLNAFLACIVTQGELRPCLVPMKNAPKDKKPRKSKSLHEVYAEVYPDVLEEMIKRYECVDDKSDSAKIEAIADKIIETYGVPDDIEPNDLKRALLRQLIRVANPKNKSLDKKSLEPEGIDAESIRKQGFDKVWEKISPVPSVICHGTDNLDVAKIRDKTKPLTLPKVRAVLRKYHRKGIRLHRKFGRIPELDMSSHNLADRLQRNFKMKLSELVEEVAE